MKTLEELIEAEKICSQIDADCSSCPYKSTAKGWCEEKDRDALHYLEMYKSEKESLEHKSYEWCTRGEQPCKEYDYEKHCCHRWSSFIRKTIADMKLVHCNECCFGESVDGEWDKYRCNCPEQKNRSVIWFGSDYCSYGVRK